MSPDYIIHHAISGLDAFHFGCACTLTAFQPIVVEPPPVRGLAADRPIHLLFNHHAYIYFIVTLWQNGSKGFPAIQKDTLYSFEI